LALRPSYLAICLRKKRGRFSEKLFQFFYLWCIAVALLAAGLLLFVDTFAAWLMMAVALTTVPARQLLMPAINLASDNNDRRRFNILHGGSVLLALIQMTVLAYVLIRLVT
jgi:hypothetical protein